VNDPSEIFFYKRNLALQIMAKAKKSTLKGEKKSSPKNDIKDVIKQSGQPPPKAITPPAKTSRKKEQKD
jgi:hypothetical protein